MQRNRTMDEYYYILCKEFPPMLYKYLNVPDIARLDKIGFLCGADYCSNNIYDLKYKYTTLNHSVATSLIVWNFTKDKKATIASLLHDISSPVFRHVIDYMNGDTLHQESTEEHTEKFILGSKQLKKCLDEDKIKLEEVLDYKKYPIADNKRPKISADRLDGLLSSNFIWLKSLELRDIRKIYNSIEVAENEFGEEELAFNNVEQAKKTFDQSLMLDKVLSQNEDKLSMMLLAKITKLLMVSENIKYGELFYYTEDEIIRMIEQSSVDEITLLWYNYKYMKKIERTEVNEHLYGTFHIDNEKFEVKKRRINPLVKTDEGYKRLLSLDEESNMKAEELDQYSDSRYAYVRLENPYGRLLRRL